jgi:hypothetical protein
MTATDTAIAATITFASLPALGAELEGGLFAGLTTKPDGTHHAVVLLPARTEDRLTWKKAKAWAAEVGGELPTRPVSALLYALAKDHVEAGWYWTADELDGSYAWSQDFDYGDQDFTHKSYEGRAVAVRLIQLTA